MPGIYVCHPDAATSCLHNSLNVLGMQHVHTKQQADIRCAAVRDHLGRA